MKLMFLSLVLLLAASPAFASEGGESRFHLLSTRCEVEANVGPESVPQSPPLEVDDPSTPGCNQWEINVVFDGDLTREQNSWETPLLDINYGIGDNVQLKYEVPYTSSSIGDSRAGIKYMFFEDEGAKVQVATYPQVTFGNAGVVTLPLLMSAKVGETRLGDLSLTANLGYNLSTRSGSADFVSALVGLGTPITNRVALMGALTTEQAVKSIEDEARDQLVRADLGVMTTINRQFLVFGSIGHSLVASDSQDHSYVLAGVRLLAGGVSAPRIGANNE